MQMGQGMEDRESIIGDRRRMRVIGWWQWGWSAGWKIAETKRIGQGMKSRKMAYSVIYREM